VHLRTLKNKDGDDILPVIFEDNYLLLAPGESRTIECSYQNKDAGNAKPSLFQLGILTLITAQQEMIPGLRMRCGRFKC